jgi:hypothetical protein
MQVIYQSYLSRKQILDAVLYRSTNALAAHTNGCFEYNARLYFPFTIRIKTVLITIEFNIASNKYNVYLTYLQLFCYIVCKKLHYSAATNYRQNMKKPLIR